VSLAITMLAYAVIAALAVAAGSGAWLVVLWVAHRHRNPELLVRRADRVQVVLDAEPVPQVVAASPPAIEPPRVYFTDDQFAAIMRQHADGEGR
jgi:hypothetical protein